MAHDDPSSPSFELPLNTVVDGGVGGYKAQYVLEAKLGEGGFGIVYRAREEKSQEAPDEGAGHVAIKIFRGPDHHKRYLAELENLRKVSALGLNEDIRLVRLVDSFIDQQHGQCCCLVMTPVATCDLQHLLASEEPSSYSLGDVVSWGLDVASALYALHRVAKLYHGDVCPRNILLGRDGHAYLTDYGISIYSHPFGNHKDDMELYKDSISVAPEMIAGNRDFDTAADVWSWGVVMDALLSRSLSRCQPEGLLSKHEIRLYQSFFHQLWPGSNSHDEWRDALQQQWAVTDAPIVTRLASIVARCLCPDVEFRLSLVTVVSSLRDMHSQISGVVLEPAKESQQASNKWDKKLIDLDQRLEQLQASSPEDKTSASYMQDAGWILSKKAKAHEELGEYSLWQSCLHQAITYLRQAGLGSSVDSALGQEALLGWASLLNRTGAIYMQKGEYINAVPLFEEALSVMRSAVPTDDHQKIGGALHNIGVCYTNLGRYTEALALYEESLAMTRRVLPGDHHYLATCLNDMAKLCDLQGNRDRALSLYEEALAIRQGCLPPDHPQIAQTLNNMAHLHQVQGRLDDALALYEEALAMRRRSLPTDHPRIGESLNNTAVIHRSKGDHAKARALSEEALVMFRRCLPPDHPQIAVNLLNLAIIHKVQGEYGLATQCCEEALAINTKALPPEHPERRRNLKILSMLQKASRKPDRLGNSTVIEGEEATSS